MKDLFDWYEPEDWTPIHQCPCCDYVTLPERNTCIICPICYWEDDGRDVGELDEPHPSGFSYELTLREGRANFKAFGACRKDLVIYVLKRSERDQYEYKVRNIDIT